MEHFWGADKQVERDEGMDSLVLRPILAAWRA